MVEQVKKGEHNGYRSDVGIVVAFKTRETWRRRYLQDEPRRATTDLFAEWSIYEGKVKDVFLQYKNTRKVV